VSVFTCEVKDGASGVQLEVARTAVKRLKTLKHPSVLTFQGSPCPGSGPHSFYADPDPVCKIIRGSGSGLDFFQKLVLFA